MKKDQLLIGRLEDKIDQSINRYMIISGDFLDMHQRKLAEDYCRGRKLPLRVIYYGGYEDAERVIPVCLPNYVDVELDGRTGQVDMSKMPEDIKELVRIARVKIPKGGKKLDHRDYLGSLLGLGLQREVTGDILVRDDGADIIVKAEIADFIELNYNKAGRVNLDLELLPIDDLLIVEADIKERTDTVASLRLDSIVASAFGLSRAKAAEAIRRGIVFVNNSEAMKVDMEIGERDKIVMRGRGKVVLDEIGGTTKKDRIRIKLSLYGKDR